jgi:ribonucleoside-diphosphate reductase alpha chain
VAPWARRSARPGLKQLIDRVVLTYAKAGKEHGYFASDEDATVFEHELTYALLHQVFSFNSPVWFNVGTKSPQQVSACFILSVDDSMDSILNWYKEEGKIFQGGSGAGLNLSRIRSSKELLSSGGTASGPVSFMRGADASAGTIKSGGATRRAAKMVVLDVDHPDIEEFIETKAREEDKIRALRDAGFDMDLGGKDIVSVQYQNANNSVRVNDEFMHAVESGSEFALRARLDGSVVETVDARELWDKIAKAAWECADPGIQYDDTINAWHTNPETGRITASNPCSEYMSLDNSSCNLASLNLLKFLRDDDTFDAVTFEKVVELIITAMDISICFADFPTEAITRITRDYRQLGIGYANLGALLMATGHGYDSEGGRTLAATITSLLTGASYRRSAELAAIVGPYAGYDRNADAHKRVMRKHQAANDNLRPLDAMDRSIHELASKAWSDVVSFGESNGFRNAQASLLAPTGTIGFMLDCDTTGIEPDFSLVKFKKLVGGGSMQIVNLTIPRALKKLGYTTETSEAIVEYIADKGHVIDAPGLKPEHYEVFDTAMGARAIPPMGHVRMMAATQPFLSGRDQQDGQPAGDSDGRGDRRRLPAGLEARPQGARGLPRQLQGRPAALRRRVDGEGRRGRQGGGRRAAGPEGRGVPPGPQAPAEAAPVADDVVLGRRGRGLPHRRLLPRRRPRRAVPQVRQAGLDAGRRDGRLLDRRLDRAAVRRAARDLRREVHQPPIRAGRPH